MMDSSKPACANASDKASQTKNCEICENKVPKYTCPGCGTKTCSLGCVKSHKESSGCNGKRKRTEFVDIKSFNDQHLRSDLRFLEDVNREADNAKRRLTSVGANRGGRSENARNVGEKARRDAARLPQRVEEFIQQAANRGTRVLIMPQGMSRRAANNSYFDRRNKAVVWRVEWRLVPGAIAGQQGGADGAADSIVVSRVSDKVSLLEAYQRDVLGWRKNDQEGGSKSIEETTKPDGAKPGSDALAQSKEIAQLASSSSSSSSSLLRRSGWPSKASFSMERVVAPGTAEEYAESLESDMEERDGAHVGSNSSNLSSAEVSSAVQHTRLDGTKTLSEVLHGHAVIEFPTIWVSCASGDCSSGS